MEKHEKTKNKSSKKDIKWSKIDQKLITIQLKTKSNSNQNWYKT